MQKQQSENLLNVVVVRPVFIQGQPGIGNESIFAVCAERESVQDKLKGI